LHRVRGVALAERAWPLAGNAVCHQLAGESPLLTSIGFLGKKTGEKSGKV
jgi:hypothetical protein